jgi:hypothetical protein
MRMPTSSAGTSPALKSLWSETVKTYLVTIQDLRPGHEGKRYQRPFEADTAEHAKEDAAATLLMTDSLIEGADFHIVSAH